MSGHESALDFARRQLQRIDEKMAELAQEKASVLSYMQTIQKHFASENGGHKSTKPIGMPLPLSDRPGSLVRQFNKQIVRIALEIMREKGEPMAAPDLHAVHPLREQFTTELLYRLLYNRVVSRKLNTMNGAFWPIEEALPHGWEGEEPTTKHARVA